MTNAKQPARGAGRKARTPPAESRAASYRSRLLAVVLAALAVKLFTLLLFSDNLRGNAWIYWDSDTYAGPAMSLARSLSYHSVHRTPGYPAFLALLYALTGDPNPASSLNLSVVLVAQSLLLSLACIPIAASIRRLTGSDRWALIGAFLFAIHNSARIYAVVVLTEAMVTFLMAVLLYAIVRILSENNAAHPRSESVSDPVSDPGALPALRPVIDSPLFWRAVAGAVLFYLVITRPSASLMAAPVALAVLLRQRALRWPGGWRRVAATLTFLVFLPVSAQWLWAQRNEIVEGERYYCRLSAYGIYAFGFAGPVAAADGIDPYAAMDRVTKEYFTLLPKTTTREMDRLFMERAKTLARERPGPILANAAAGTFWMMVPTLYKPPGGHYRDNFRPDHWRRLSTGERLAQGFHLLNSALELLLVLVLLTCVGSMALPGRTPADPARRAYLVAFALLYAVWWACHATAAWYATARFLLPIVPFLLAAAMIGAAEISERKGPPLGTRKRRHPSRAGRSRK